MPIYYRTEVDKIEEARERFRYRVNWLLILVLLGVLVFVAVLEF